MNAEELFSFLEKLDPKTRKELKIFVRQYGPTSNIKEIDSIKECYYGFFGKQIPCLLLNDDTNKEK